MSSAREATEQLLGATEDLERALSSSDPEALECALQRRLEGFQALERATARGAVPPAALIDRLLELDARVAEGARAARDTLLADLASLRGLRDAVGSLRQEQPEARFVSRRA